MRRYMSIPARQVIEDTASDYRFRAFLDRDRVAERIAEAVRAINYSGSAGGFKANIRDKRRSAFYFDVWDIGWQMQEQLG